MCLQVVSQIMRPDWSANVLVTGWALNALFDRLISWSCMCFSCALLWSCVVTDGHYAVIMLLCLIMKQTASLYFTPLDVTLCGLTMQKIAMTHSCRLCCLRVSLLVCYSTLQMTNSAEWSCKLWDRNNSCCLQAKSHTGTGTILTGFVLDRNWQLMFWRR